MTSSLPTVCPASALLVLRCPDIIGPYDDTGRFWATLLWIQHAVLQGMSGRGMSAEAVVALPRSLQATPMSFVFSLDLVAAMRQSIRRALTWQSAEISGGAEGVPARRPALGVGDVFICNVASQPPMTLRMVVEVVAAHIAAHARSGGGGDAAAMAASISVASSVDTTLTDQSGVRGVVGRDPSSQPDVVIAFVKSRSPIDTCDYFPSVSCGPLSTRLATACLDGWAPTATIDAVGMTTRWFLALRQNAHSHRHGAPATGAGACTQWVDALIGEPAGLRHCFIGVPLAHRSELRRAMNKLPKKMRKAVSPWLFGQTTN
jgi:hypothetical protein